MLENIPTDEPKQIEHIVQLTMQQLQMRYPGADRVRRGVHAKDHGCVTATFEVLPGIAENLRQGVFSQPGKKYSALVRFSNASTGLGPDSPPATAAIPASPEKLAQPAKPLTHGSRGMAIKLLGVEGSFIEPLDDVPTQDFLMINQPVFAFANVVDYEFLSQVLVDHKDDPRPFFKRLPPTGTKPTTPAEISAAETAGIFAKIQSASPPFAFQAPPASPVDNNYFGASPFLMGPDQVMRFRVRPVFRSSEEPDVSKPNYLRAALVTRLSDCQAGDVVFHFEVHVRPASSIDPDQDIENASHPWEETSTSYWHVATLTIPLQEFDTTELNERCEQLIFSPWHCLEAHRPLGGINRLRRAVYEASAKFRRLPKEPAPIN